MAIPTDPVRERSAFEKLPLEIRRQVYDELLKADKVRQPPNNKLVRSYQFETAILGVNKQIYVESSDTLYHGNRFVVVTTNWRRFLSAMDYFEVAAISALNQKAVSTFDKHVLQLHMEYRAAPPDDKSVPPDVKVKQRCLLVADEFGRFVRALRITMAGAAMTGFHFTFFLESPSNGPRSLTDQRLVLEPFRRLKLRGTDLVLTGAVDPAYASNLKASMVPAVNWLRGFAWEDYDLLVSIANRGNEAFYLGKYDLAKAKYYDCFFTWKTACLEMPRMISFFNNSNEVLGLLADQLQNIVRINHTLASLRAQNWEYALKATEDLLRRSTTPSTPPKGMSMIHHMRAIALSTQGLETLASAHLVQALDFDPNSGLIRSHISIMRSRVDVKISHELEAIETISSLQSLEQLHPLAYKWKLALVPCPGIDKERYILRYFNYPGDLLEGIKDTALVDTEEMKDLVQKLEKELADTEACKKYSIWVVDDGLRRFHT